MEFNEKFQLRWHLREIMACAETNVAYNNFGSIWIVEKPLLVKISLLKTKIWSVTALRKTQFTYS